MNDFAWLSSRQLVKIIVIDILATEKEAKKKDGKTRKQNGERKEDATPTDLWTTTCYIPARGMHHT